MRRARCWRPRVGGATARPASRRGLARAPRVPSGAASRGARPGTSRRPPPVRSPATRPCAVASRSAGCAGTCRAPPAAGAAVRQHAPAQRRRRRRPRVGAGPRLASSARSTNSPGVRKRRLAPMPYRSASVFCSQRRIEDCGTRTMSGRSQSPSARQFRQFCRQHAREHVQVVAVVEAEVGRARHRGMLPDAGRNGRDGRNPPRAHPASAALCDNARRHLPFSRRSPILARVLPARAPFLHCRSGMTDRSPIVRIDQPPPRAWRPGGAARHQPDGAARQHRRGAGTVGQRQVDVAGSADWRAAGRRGFGAGAGTGGAALAARAAGTAQGHRRAAAGQRPAHRPDRGGERRAAAAHAHEAAGPGDPAPGADEVARGRPARRRRCVSARTLRRHGASRRPGARARARSAADDLRRTADRTGSDRQRRGDEPGARPQRHPRPDQHRGHPPRARDAADRRPCGGDRQWRHRVLGYAFGAGSQHRSADPPVPQGRAGRANSVRSRAFTSQTEPA